MKYPPGFIGHFFAELYHQVLMNVCDLFTHIDCQPDEPLASLVTTNRIINVYGFLAVIMLLMYSFLHCLYTAGNKITTTTIFFDCASLVLWQVNNNRAILKAMVNWLLWNQKKKNIKCPNVLISVDMLDAFYLIIPPTREMLKYRCRIPWHEIMLCTVLVLFSINFHSTWTTSLWKGIRWLINVNCWNKVLWWQYDCTRFMINSLRPGVGMRQQRTESILVQVMACYLFHFRFVRAHFSEIWK